MNPPKTQRLERRVLEPQHLELQPLEREPHRRPAQGTAPYVFAQAPLLIYWEVTRACDLACRHCRAEAIAARHPGELSTEEGRAMLREARRFGDPPPHLVITGGDPLKRPDLWDLIGAAVEQGFGVSLAPSGTVLLTREVIDRLAAAGIQSMSLSLDGSTAERHDAFRGVPGCFEVTLRAARWVREANIPLQVNTLVTAETLEDLPDLYALLRGLDIMRWSLFFLISVGRGRLLQEITPGQSERLFHWLLDLTRDAPFAIKTTEATHYRRVAVVRMRAAGMDDAAIARTPVGRGFGVRDGNGIMFVSHTGEVYPSGFLPLPAGNVRTASIVDLYRTSPLFVRLRDVERLTGKCGACSFKAICGGSRARAYAWTGDEMGSDPLCPYQP
jgi:radical SAM protein